MLKFNRRYRCVFRVGKRTNFKKEKTDQSFEIGYPYTLQFQVEAGCYQTSQRGVFRFYNINPDYQKSLWKESYDGNKYIEVELYAGYGDNMPLIFAGDVMKCYTSRKGGDTDFITEMEVSAAPEVFKNGFANQTISKGAEVASVFNDLFKGIPDVGIGYITKELGKLKRSTAYIGNPIDLIKNAYGSKYEIFIENGLLNVLAEGEVKQDKVLTVTAASGLLGSPQREGALTEVEMIFEPQATVAGLVNVLSDSMPELNGTFKCLNVSHQGIISYSGECGKVVTKLVLTNGKNIFIDENGKLRQVSPYQQDVWNGNPVVNGWKRPVNGGRIRSSWGVRRDPNNPNITKFHNGIDFGVNVGTDIIAVADFINAELLTDTSGYGTYIKLNHGTINGKNVYSLYAHLSATFVANKSSGSIGSVIGKSGGAKGAPGSGNSTGPHLHFSIIENGVFVDPNKYIKLS